MAAAQVAPAVAVLVTAIAFVPATEHSVSATTQGARKNNMSLIFFTFVLVRGSRWMRRLSSHAKEDLPQVVRTLLPLYYGCFVLTSFESLGPEASPSFEVPKRSKRFESFEVIVK